jgi:type IV secretory pathway VirB2 component (pilin)
MVTGRAPETARQAARSEPMQLLARFGLAARACVYLLIGVLAVALAAGHRRRETDQRGAMQELSRHSGGTLLVWLIAFGLFAYALWRFTEAAFGTVGEGRKVGPRIQSLVRGLIYTFFGVSAVKVAAHAHAGSQRGQQELWTAKALQHPGGRLAVGIVGIIVVVCGLVLAWEGLTRKFEKYFKLAEMTPRQRRVVEFLGTVGGISRGVVFAVAGVLVMVAAVKAKPSESGGLDRALRQLADTPLGPALLLAAGVGLALFGIYGFAEARWRRT